MAGKYSCQNLKTELERAETTELAMERLPCGTPEAGQWSQLEDDYKHVGHNYFWAQYNAIRLLLSNSLQNWNQFAKPRLLTLALAISKSLLYNDRGALLSMKYTQDRYRALNGLVPRLMLELGRNQEAYDFVKWWILHSEVYNDFYNASTFVMWNEMDGAGEAGCELSYLSLRNEPMDEVFVPYNKGIKDFCSGQNFGRDRSRAARRRHEFFPDEKNELNVFEISLDHAVAIAMIKHRALIQARVPYQLKYILAMGHSLRRSESSLRYLPNEIVIHISNFAFGIKDTKAMNTLRSETYAWFLRVHCLNREIWPCVVQPTNHHDGVGYNLDIETTIGWSGQRDGDKFKGSAREINQWVHMWRKEPFSVEVLRDWFQTTPVGVEWISHPKCTRCGIFNKCCLIPGLVTLGHEGEQQFEFCYACGPGNQKEITDLHGHHFRNRERFSLGPGRKQIPVFDVNKWYTEHTFAHKYALKKRAENEHLLQQMMGQIKSKIVAEEETKEELNPKLLHVVLVQRFSGLVYRYFRPEQEQRGEWNNLMGVNLVNEDDPPMPKSDDPLYNDMRQIFLILQNVTDEYLSKALPQLLKLRYHGTRQTKVLFPRSSIEKKWLSQVQQSDMKGIRVLDGGSERYRYHMYSRYR